MFKRSGYAAIVALLLIGVDCQVFAAGRSPNHVKDEPTIRKIVRTVRTIIRVRTNGDGLHPPLPAPCPPNSTCP